MSRRRRTPEQVVRKLREADRLLGEANELPEVLKQLEVSEQTYYRWRNQFGGMKAEDVKRLKKLEAENARLQRIAADQVLENQALREVSRGIGEPAAPAPGGPAALGPSRYLRSGGRVGMSGSRGRRSGASRSLPRMTRRCGQSCGRSLAIGRGGGIARRTSICSVKAGASTASGGSGWEARKGCACRRNAANASGAGNRRSRATGCAPSVPTTCGHLTSSSTGPTTAAR